MWSFICLFLVLKINLSTALFLLLGSVRFLINIFTGTGEFEVCESGTVVVKGKIRNCEGIGKEGLNFGTNIVPDTERRQLKKEHVYRDLRLRGYEYQDMFQGIMMADNSGLYCNVYILIWSLMQNSNCENSCIISLSINYASNIINRYFLTLFNIHRECWRVGMEGQLYQFYGYNASVFIAKS